MRPLDWIVLVASLAFIVIYGVWKGRGSRNLRGFLLADQNMRWWTIALSIMATQASAITFLSTPGQAYVDGMRFVQFYFGLPIAMVVLSMTAVPIYRRLKVFTAYEYLEKRFDGKTRSLAALLFLVQRGLAAGLTIYAPAIVLSVLLGWNLAWTTVMIGVLVTTYTALGGTRAVNYTQFHQFLIILGGMGLAFALVIKGLPAGIGVVDAVAVAGKLGKLNVVDFSVDLNDRYTLWSGLIGGFFLQLSYFGTDQSQVGRYLTGRDVGQSRLSLLFNGIVKIPMQFGILFLGAMVFAFYLFVMPPLFFNPHEVRQLEDGGHGAAYAELEGRHAEAFEHRRDDIHAFIDARHAKDPIAEEAAVERLRRSHAAMQEVRGDAVGLMKANDPGAQTSDTNYVFLTFVLNFLPAGVVGLVLAAIFAASMSSTAAELNALASTTVVDAWRRIRKRSADAARQVAEDSHEVTVSKWATAAWGVFAIGFALFAGHLGSLIEAINIMGSLFYGTILGIFMTAFLFKRISGHAVFFAAIAAELCVVYAYLFTGISFLWYNLIGCVLVVMVAHLLQPLVKQAPKPPA